VVGAALVAAIISAPTADEIKALVKEDSYCALSSGLDQCEVQYDFTAHEVRDLSCNDTEWPREFACSYNVLIKERNGLYPSYWSQRVDQFRLMEDGAWFHVQAIIPPQNFN
jgi:hypothetical protein